PSDPIGARQTEPLSDLDDQGGELELLATGWRLLRLAEIDGAGAKPDGAVERGDQLRHELLHALVLHAAQAIGQELRARQHVAQIVADLADGKAERGEPVLLSEHAGELGLHGGKLTLCGADLIAPSGRHDDARRVLRTLAEPDHVPGKLGHWL